MSTFLEERHLTFRAVAQRVAKTLADIDDHQARVAVKKMGEAGLLAACVPAAYGGLRDTVELRDLVVARAALGYESPLGDALFAIQGLGSYPVTIAGSEAQRRDLLPRIIAGNLICAFAMTEPEAGSDAGAIATRARQEGDAYVLDGEKCFISNAGIADAYVVFARSSDDKHRGLDAFWVEAKSAGLKATPTTLITPHPIGTVRFDNCRVPASQRLGKPGDGFSIAMATLDLFRTCVGAAAVGMAARARDEAIAHVKSRRQFGRPLADFQATQMTLADIATDVATSTLLVLSAAHRVDTSGPSAIDSSMAKLWATESAFRVVDRALQLHGARALVSGHILERLYRDIRALRIYEGTSEIQKLIIAKALLR